MQCRMGMHSTFYGPDPMCARAGLHGGDDFNTVHGPFHVGALAVLQAMRGTICDRAHAVLHGSAAWDPWSLPWVSLA